MNDVNDEWNKVIYLRKYEICQMFHISQYAWNGLIRNMSSLNVWHWFLSLNKIAIIWYQEAIATWHCQPVQGYCRTRITAWVSLIMPHLCRLLTNTCLVDRCLRFVAMAQHMDIFLCTYPRLISVNLSENLYSVPNWDNDHVREWHSYTSLKCIVDWCIGKQS